MTREFAVGIVGAAGRGQCFLNTFNHHPNTRLAALCDLDVEGLRASAAEVGVEKVYTSYEEMLDRGGIDIVLIGTPMPLHVPQALAALERDIHVLSEVPAAVSIEEARALVRACRKSNARYMMAENYCYMRPNVLVKAIAEAGLFGDLYFAEGEYIHELKEWNETKRWRRRWQTGINGNTYPTHSLGPVLQWMQERIVSVCCAGSGHHYRDPRGDEYEQEDSIVTLCRTEKGGLVTLRLDMLSERPCNMVYYSLQGTTGSYEAPRGLGDEPAIWLADRGAHHLWMPLKELEEEFLPAYWRHPPDAVLQAGHDGSDHWVIHDFVSAILQDREPAIGIHEAMDMTLPGLVSQQSITRGSIWLPVPDSRTWETGTAPDGGASL